MEIQYLKGDIFKHKSDKRYMLVHGCNAQGVMGSGVAKTFKDLYPGAYAKYQEDVVKFSSIPRDRLGNVSYFFAIDRNETEVILCSAITQENYGRDGSRYVSYEAIFDSFRDIFNVAFSGSMDVVMPKIGCGLGGGDWFVVSSIIQLLSIERPDLKVIVYEY